jgi:hypothetical protein
VINNGLIGTEVTLTGIVFVTTTRPRSARASRFRQLSAAFTQLDVPAALVAATAGPLMLLLVLLHATRLTPTATAPAVNGDMAAMTAPRAAIHENDGYGNVSSLKGDRAGTR